MDQKTISVGDTITTAVRSNPRRSSLEFQNASDPLGNAYVLYYGNKAIDPDNDIGSVIAAGTGVVMDGADAKAGWFIRRKSGETDDVRILWVNERP